MIQYINARRTIIPIVDILKEGMKIESCGKWLIVR